MRRGFRNLKYLGFNNHLFPAVGGKIEDEDGEKGDAHAGDDQVDRVEQRLPPHRDVEGDVKVRLVTTRVELDISLGWHLQRAESRLYFGIIPFPISIYIEPR